MFKVPEWAVKNKPTPRAEGVGIDWTAEHKERLKPIAFPVQKGYENTIGAGGKEGRKW